MARRSSPERGATAVAVLGGALAGEALLFLAFHSQRAGSPVLVAELALGVALVGAAAWPGRTTALATAAVASPAAALADGALRMAMRAQGWGA
jgi:hypothetical protein